LIYLKIIETIELDYMKPLSYFDNFYHHLFDDAKGNEIFIPTKYHAIS